MNSRSMAGWIGFAGILMLIIGMIDFFQGLIGLFKDDYYVVTASGFLAVNLTTWSWVLLIWGVLLVLAGLGLLGGQGWARWFTIVVVASELLRSARLPRQQPVPALGADGPDAQRDRALRAHGALGREPGGPGQGIGSPVPHAGHEQPSRSHRSAARDSGARALAHGRGRGAHRESTPQLVSQQSYAGRSAPGRRRRARGVKRRTRG